MKKIILITIVVIESMLFSACDYRDVTDQVANVVQEEDENVVAVKGGTNSEYPDKTYGEAFDDFFGSPTWKYFQGTVQGSDEDGDGESDYETEDVDVVEFTGYCTYHDVEVKALIQFTLDKDEGTFEATYLSFNDVPQANLVLWAVLDAAFAEESNSEDDNSTEQELMDEEYDSYDF